MANVGSATLTIVPSAKGFQRSLERDINGPIVAGGRKAGKDAGDAAGKGLMGGLLPVAGRIVPVLGAALGGLAIGSYVQDSIGAASDLNETVSKTATVIGKKATPAVIAYGDKAAAAFGLSKREALDAVSTFAVFGRSAGLRGKELGSFGTRLTSLSADFASFYNTSPEEAITAIGAALRGESEPIRRYGVLLDSNTLKQRAFKMGLIDSMSATLTPQKRVLAAQAEILRQSKVAQGDVKRTSGGLANTQRRFAAGMENLKASIGKAFLPLATKVVGVFSDKILPAVTAFVDAVSPAFAAIGEALGAIFGGGAANEAKNGIASVGKAFAGQKDTFATIAEIAGSVGDVLATIGGIIRDYVLPAAQEIGAAFAGFLGEAFRAVGEILRDTVAPAVKDLAARFKEFAPKVAPIIGFLAKLWAAWYRLYYSALAKVLVVIIKIAGFMLGRMIDGISAVVTAISAAIDFVSNFGQSWSDLVRTVREKVAAVVNFVKGLPGKIRGVFANAGTWLLSAGKNVVQGLVNGIKSLASAPVDAIKSIGSTVINGAKSIFGIASPSKVFKKIGEFVGEGFVKGIVASRREVAKAMNQLGRLTVKSGKSALVGLVEQDEARLLRLAGRRDRMLKRLDAQKERLQTLTSDKESYFDSLRSGLLDEATLDNNGGSFDAIIRRFETAVSLSKKFDASLESLRKAKLDPALIQQIGELGARDGIATAGLVLQRGPEGIQALNSLQKELDTSATATAKKSSDALFNAGIQSAQGLIKGLEKELPKIEKAMTRIANALATAVKKALGIKSPSKVFEEIGGFTMAGFVQGVESGAGSAQGAMLAAVAPPGAPSIGSSVAPGGAGAGLTVVVNNPVPEPASKSLQTSLSRVAYLGIGG